MLQNLNGKLKTLFKNYNKRIWGKPWVNNIFMSWGPHVEISTTKDVLQINYVCVCVCVCVWVCVGVGVFVCALVKCKRKVIL